MLHRLAVKGVVLSLMVWSFIAPLGAQDVPQIDVFAGYSFLRSQTGGTKLSFTDADQTLRPIDGFNASITGNFNRWVGLTGDLSGYYNDAGIKNHTLLVGPQLSFRQVHGITPYLHSLFGISYQSPAKQSPILSLEVINATNGTPGPAIPVPVVPRLHGSNTSFAMAFGGGVDYNVNPRFSVRLIQADYFRDSFKFTRGFVDESCTISTTTACSITPVFNSVSEKHNNLRLSFGVVFHLE